MSTLQRKVIHDCMAPAITVPSTMHRWTCPECGTEWEWRPSLAVISHRTERYGFLGLRKRHHQETLPGGYWWSIHRPERWVDVEATP